MKNPVIAYIGWLLIFAMAAFYIYGIVEAIGLTIRKGEIGEDEYPKFLSTTIGSLQALLLANLGAALGIAVAKPTSTIAQWILLKNTAPLPPPTNFKVKIQLFAVVIYVLSLIACTIVWICNDFDTNSKQVVEIVAESGKMFFGVGVAYVMALLS